jgi:exopolysaccharide biosynthesis polyprenyl glycosylphosphotransferase
LLFITDLLVTPIGMLLATWARQVLPFGQALRPESAILPWPIYPAAAVCWSLSLGLSGAYDAGRVLRWWKEGLRVAVASVLATTLLAGVLYMTYRETSRLQFVYFFLINLSLMLLYRAALRLSYRQFGRRRAAGRDRVLIAGAGDLGQRIARTLQDRSRWGYDLVGFLDDDPGKAGQSIDGVTVLGTLDAVASVVAERTVDEVWIALPPRAHARLSWIVSALETLPVRAKIVPDYFSLALVRARAEIVGGIPVIGLREPLIEGGPRVVKRVFDLVVAILLLIFMAPLFAAVAVAIRLDSPGAAFFRQTRVGENGRLFGMVKFRTMVRDAEQRAAEVVRTTADGDVIHKRKQDPRITRVGGFLRRFSIDEWPQLLNVVVGDMSLVGPRPEMPWLVDRYEPWQRKRFAVPQGMTGWWQINGRSDKPMHMHTEDDLYYVYNYSLWLDIQILLRTPLAVLRARGAF